MWFVPLSITQEDVAVWPYIVNILFVWPQGAADLGKFDISHLELLIMFEQSAGH